MANRRYSDEEVAAIFQRAAEAPQTPRLPVAREEGMTLADLQEIGREVGMSPESVALAAQSLEVDHRPASQTMLGLPVGVGRTVALGRRLTEEEWEHLVVELREVFRARGTVSASGSFRQWTNGNLQALLEPTPRGHRLRLQTLNGAARFWMATGLAALGVAGAMSLVFAADGLVADALPGIIFISTVGLGMLANGALRLPGWARLRRSQMDGIAERLALSSGSSPGGTLPPPPE